MGGDEEGEGVARAAIGRVDVEGVLAVGPAFVGREGFHLYGGIARGALVPDGGIDGGGFEIFGENTGLCEGADGDEKQG